MSLGEGGEYAEVLETFRMFAHDRGWVRRIREAVETGLTAEAAVERVQGENRARMVRTRDPYLRDRMHDLDDLANRLLRILTGQIATAAQGELPQNAIVVARNMGPAELLDYDRTQAARRGARRSRGEQPCRHRGARARRAGGRTGHRHHRFRRDGRSDHRRWRARRDPRPALARHRAGLCRKGQVLCPAPGAICRAAAISPR